MILVSVHGHAGVYLHLDPWRAWMSMTGVKIPAVRRLDSTRCSGGGVSYELFKLPFILGRFLDLLSYFFL
jgi:hypothetical protein